MKKTITIAAYNRPSNLARLLDSLKGQLTSLEDYDLFIRIDVGGKNFEEVRDLAKSVNFISTTVGYPLTNQGINRNTYETMWWAFEVVKADFNLYLEDDLLLSPDALSLAEWYIQQDLEDVAAGCLCNLAGSLNPEKVILARAFIGWGFVMSRDQWHTYAKPVWLSGKGMWDNRLANAIRATGPEIHNMLPELSRITNTGRVGVHFTVERFDRLMKRHKYQEEPKLYDFRFKS